MNVLENPDFEKIQPKVESDRSSKLCVICSNDTSTDNDRSGYHERRKGDKWDSASSVKILTCYILQNPLSSSSNKNREELQLQRDILSCFNNGNLSICSECLSKAENLLELHLELEKIQMQILDVLKGLQDYLKSSGGATGHPVEMEIHDNVMLSRFQEVLLHEFMCRELLDGTQVRLERLTSAGYGNGIPSSLFHPASENISSCEIGSGNDQLITTDIKLDDDDVFSQQSIYQSAINDVHDDNEEDPLKETEDYNDNDDNVSSDQDEGQEDDKECHSRRLLPRKRGEKGPITWDCEICLERIPYQEMTVHLQTHPQFEKFYECELCPPSNRNTKRIYGTFKGLIWHNIRRQHNLLIHCQLCRDSDKKKILFKNGELCRHLYEFHKINHKKLSCREEDCSMEFCDPKNLTVHHALKHKHSNSKGASKKKKSRESMKNSKKEEVKPKRSKSISSKYELNRLVEVVHGTKKRKELTRPRLASAYCSPSPFHPVSKTRSGNDPLTLAIDIKVDEHERNQDSIHHRLMDMDCTVDDDDNDDDGKTEDPLQENDEDDKDWNLEEAEVSSDPGQVQDEDDDDNKEDHIRLSLGRKRGEKGPITWDCEICLKRIPYQEMTNHLQSHPEFEKFYECALCPPSNRTTKRIYGTFKGLIWHYIRRQHKVLCPCQLCPDSDKNILFKNGDLCKHLYDFHKINHKKLSCKYEYCSKEFCDPKTLTAHNAKKHFPPPTWESKLQEKAVVECHLCSKSIASKYHLNRHLKVVHGIQKQKEFPCPILTCLKVFKRECDRKKHCKVVHEGKKRGSNSSPLQCQYCPKTFFLKFNLQNHEEIHRGERKYKCTEVGCSYVGNTDDDLRSHKRIHDPQKKITFICQHCPETFASRQKLKIHEEKFHEKNSEAVEPPPEKKKWKRKPAPEPLTCQFCPKTFRWKGNLYVHEKRHRTRIQQAKAMNKPKPSDSPEGGDDDEPCPPLDLDTSTNPPPPPRKHGEKGPITWDCEICLERIPYQGMSLHLRRHPEFERFYECDICPTTDRPTKRIYGTYKGLIWHYLMKNHVVQMPCKLCPDSEQSILFQRTELCKHLYEFHQINHRKLPCKEKGCPEEFYYHNARNHHHDQVHSSRKIPKESGKLTWDCEICLKSIPYHEMKLHLKAHPEFEKYYECQYCPPTSRVTKRIFGTFKGLIWHYLRRKHIVKVSCQLCPDSEQSKSFLRADLCKHLYEFHHINHPKLRCRYEDCSEEFYDPQAQSFHHTLKHSVRTEENSLRCPHCFKLFSKSRLTLHLNKGKCRKKKNLKKKKKTGPYRKPMLQLQCQFCPKIFHIKYRLQLHEQSHQNLRSFKCPEPDCPYAGNTSAVLRNHLKTHQEKTLKCQYCPFKCRTKELLGNHERTHTKERPFKCPVEGCQMSFRTQSQRGKHETSRHGIPRQRRINPVEKKVKEKVYMCELCPKQYKDNRDLRRHKEAVHDGNPELVKCLYCEKMFRKHRMHYHVKSVHGEKLLRCGSCTKTFVWEDWLKLHEEHAHGIYK